jgi:hypothetical protein
MKMEEVGLFVDFENIRYGVRNIYHRELRADLLMEKAKSYGLVMVAKAYGDFAKEHPKFLRELYNVGIEAVNLPKRQGWSPRMEKLCGYLPGDGYGRVFAGET